MAEIISIAKKWGSSLGVIIPKDIVIKERIRPNEKVTIEIKKTHKVSEVWGILQKDWKHSTQYLKNEAKKGWD